MIQYLSFLFFYTLSLLFTVLSMSGLGYYAYIIEFVVLILAIAVAFYSLDFLLKEGNHGNVMAASVYGFLLLNAIWRLFVPVQAAFTCAAGLFSLLGLLLAILTLKPRPKKLGRKPEPIARIERELSRPKAPRSRDISSEWEREARNLEKAQIQVVEEEELEKEKNALESAEEEIEEMQQEAAEDELTKEAESLSFAEQEIEEAQQEAAEDELTKEADELSMAAQEVEKAQKKAVRDELKREAKQLSMAEQEMKKERKGKSREEKILKELKKDIEKIRKSKNIRFKR